jgi:hypothetical protein
MFLLRHSAPSFRGSASVYINRMRIRTNLHARQQNRRVAVQCRLTCTGVAWGLVWRATFTRAKNVVSVKRTRVRLFSRQPVGRPHPLVPLSAANHEDMLADGKPSCQPHNSNKMEGRLAMYTQGPGEGLKRAKCAAVATQVKEPKVSGMKTYTVTGTAATCMVHSGRDINKLFGACGLGWRVPVRWVLG